MIIAHAQSKVKVTGQLVQKIAWKQTDGHGRFYYVCQWPLSRSVIRPIYEQRVFRPLGNRERKCADTMGTVLVVLWAGHFNC